MEGKRANLILRLEDTRLSSRRRGRHAAVQDREGLKVVRGDSGARRSDLAARSGRPGGVAAEGERGGRPRSGGSAATGGHLDGLRRGPPRASYP